MTATQEQRRRHWRHVARNDHRFQFGQPANSTKTTNGGHLGCGHQAVSFLARGWGTGSAVTQDRVSELADFPYPGQSDAQGLRVSQVLRALARLGMPYEPRFNMDVDEVIDIIKHRGPVIFLELYTSHPEMLGSEYFGVRADGRPNGFARPLGLAGANQLTGKFFGHWLVAFGARPMLHRGRSSHDILVRDSNHASSSRPQEVPFDRVTRTQLYWMINSFRIIADGNDTVVCVPKETWNG